MQLVQLVHLRWLYQLLYQHGGESVRSNLVMDDVEAALVPNVVAGHHRTEAPYHFLRGWWLHQLPRGRKLARCGTSGGCAPGCGGMMASMLTAGSSWVPEVSSTMGSPAQPAMARLHGSLVITLVS